MRRLPESSTKTNQRRLFLLRTTLIILQVLFVIVATGLLNMHLPLLPVFSIILVYSGFNAISWWNYRKQREISDKSFFFQIVIDALMLSSLLYFIGGATNPFISLLLLPLIIVAATLPAHFAWLMAAITIACYTVLMFIYIPMPHVALRHGADSDMHILGMWFSFLVGVSLILMFVIRMAETIRERDNNLAQARERALRDDNLIALGTFAAGAAHELSTPLSTMAVIAKEIQLNSGQDEIIEQATVLRDQIERCKTTLTQISARAGDSRAEGGQVEPLDEFLKKIVKKWQTMRPSAHLTKYWHGSLPPPNVIVDETLSQAIINLLNNAADVSPDNVELIGEWKENTLELNILDRGPGIPEEFTSPNNQNFSSTKEDGQGLGLFITHAVVNRFGGKLLMESRSNGGTNAKIILPLSRILATQ